MSLSIRLKQARQKKKLTQSDLAAAIGVKQQAIQRIEAGKVKSSGYVVQMAKVLGVPAEWLAMGSTDCEIPIVNKLSTNQFLPIIKWSELSNLTEALANNTETVAAISKVGPKSFATYVPDESMHSSDGTKLGFHRNDLLLIDGSRTPNDGDFVIAKRQGQILFRQYVNDGTGAYLRAFNSQYESLSCNSTTKFYGVVVNRVTSFL